MGTVPAPNIVADIQSGQQGYRDSLEEYARSTALQNNADILGQQQQQEALKTQQEQLQSQDAATLRSSAAQYVQKDKSGRPTGFDYDGWIDNAAQQGVDPQTLQKIQVGRAQARQQLATARKDELANHEAVNKESYEIAEAVKGITDPAQRQAAYDKWHQHAQAQGLDTSAFPQQVPDNNGLSVLEIPLGMHAQEIADAKTRQEAGEKEAQARKQNADAAHQEFVNDLTKNSKPGDFDTQIDAMLPPNDPKTGGENRFTKAQVNASLNRGDLEGAKKFIDQAYQSQLGLNKEIQLATNPQVQAGKVSVAGATAKARAHAAAGDWESPDNPAIDMVGNNQIDLATVLSRVPPAAKAKFLSNLSAAYPDYEQAVYQARAALRKSATSGDIGKNITAYNTAISHAQQLQQAADALDNGDLRVLNAVGNKLGYEFGSDRSTNFNVIKNALSGEISKVFKGGEATDAEIKAVQEPFSAANSPKQLKGAIDNAIHLMNSKRDALKSQYEQGMQGKPNFGGGASAGGKTLSLAQIRQAAKDHNVSTDEAIRQAKAAGYTIQ